MTRSIMALIGAAALAAVAPAAFADGEGTTNPVGNVQSGGVTDDGLVTDIFTNLLVDGNSTQDMTELFPQSDLDNSINVYTTTPLTYSAIASMASSSNSLASLLPAPPTTSTQTTSGNSSGPHPFAIVVGYSISQFYFYFSAIAVLTFVAGALLLMHNGNLAEFGKHAVGFILLIGLVFFVGYLAA